MTTEDDRRRQYRESKRRKRAERAAAGVPTAARSPKPAKPRNRLPSVSGEVIQRADSDRRRVVVTPEQAGMMIGALRAGNTYGVACSVAGIHTRTWEMWKAMAAAYDAVDIVDVPEGDRPNVDLARRAQQARSEAVLMYLSVIRNATMGRKGKLQPTDNGMVTVESEMLPDWRAAAWFLEHGHADEWGNKYTIKQEQKDDVVRQMVQRMDPLFTEIGITPEQRLAFGRRLLEVITAKGRLDA